MISCLLQRFKQSGYWKDIAWVLSGNSMAQIIAILALPLITRLYSPADFALQALFMQVTGGITVLLSLRYEFFIQLPKKDTHAKDLLLLIIFLCIIGVLIASPFFWFLKKDIALFLGNPELAMWLVFIPVTSALLSIAIALQHYLQRQREYRKSSMSELASKGSYVSTAIVGSYLFSSTTGLILAQPMASLGKIIALTQFCVRSEQHKNYKFKYKKLKQGVLKYWRLSLSLVFSHLMLSATLLIPSVFIAKNYGSSILGQYALVVSTIYLPSAIIGAAIGQVYYQRAAENWSNGNNSVELWYTTSKKLLLVALPIYSVLFFISPIIYPFIFGSHWHDAGGFARLISISAFFAFISSPLDRACLVVGAWWYMPLWHVARTITTGLVAWIAFYYSLSSANFVLFLVMQMSLLYLIDYWSEWKFSHRKVDI